MDLSVADKAVQEPVEILAETLAEEKSLTGWVADSQAREAIVRHIVEAESSEGVLKVAAFQSSI